MSINNSDIQKVYEISNAFYLNYIKNFQSEMEPKKFNKFRCYFLNILTEVILIFNILNLEFK